MPVIDCHHHFQDRARFPASFPPAVGNRLDRDFSDTDLRPALAECGIDKTILVQLLNDVGETEYCLDLQEKLDYVAGVVGWVPLADPRRARRRWSASPGATSSSASATSSLMSRTRSGCCSRPCWNRLVCSQRPDWPSRAFLSTTDNSSLWLAMTRLVPNLKVVLNHMGNPPVPEEGWEPWATQIARAAELPNMSVKLSVGLALVVRWTWSTPALRKYAARVIELFSPDRVMAGSNWPVILLGATFQQAWRGIEDLIAGLQDEDQRKILGGTALRIYGI